jgi:hypothetical protein
VNDAIGRLRLLELEPLKLAIMDALQRAWSMMPPLYVHCADTGQRTLEHGFEPRVELKRAIDCLAIDDVQLRRLSVDFYDACDAAGQAWFNARRYLELHNLEVSLPSIKLAYTQPPFNGEKAVAGIRDLYIQLSQHIEAVLR